MESLKTIEQAINIAISKGAYNLQEADVIITALKQLNKELNKSEDVS